jgi:hypothetical protein
VLVAAALLVLVALALFVAGLLTGVPALYWGCVAASMASGAVLVVVRRRLSAPSGRPAASDVATAVPVSGGTDDPPVEDVEVPDLLVVIDLQDEVLVVDERPRYHVAGCDWLGRRPTIPLPLDEARADGFTPCRTCRPDRTLAQRARARARPSEPAP